MRINLLLICCLALIACTAQPTAPVDRSSAPVAKNKTAAALNVELGAHYISRGEYQLANDKIKRALKQDPKSSSAHWTYALLQERLGQFEVAEKYYKDALAIDPNDSRGQNNYGTFLCKQRRYIEADQHFQKALSDPLYKFRAAGNLNAGVCIMEIPNYELAKGYFKEVLRLQPDNRVALYQMAKLYFLQNAFLEARGYIQKFEKVSEHTAGSLLLAYRAERGLGNAKDARIYADKLTSSFPSSDEAEQLARMN